MLHAGSFGGRRHVDVGTMLSTSPSSNRVKRRWQLSSVHPRDHRNMPSARPMGGSVGAEQEPPRHE